VTGQAVPRATPRTIGIIQARMASTRLPGKVLAPLAGRTLLALLHARLRSARVDAWWLATTIGAEDRALIEEGRRLGMETFAGSVDDVLSRFTHIIRVTGAERIVRVTADDPFMHGEVVDLLSKALDLAPVAAVVGPGPEAGMPLGFVPQIARAETLLEAEAAIAQGEEFHRSHVLSWLATHGRSVTFAPPASWPHRPAWRWTVDEPADLAMAQAAFAAVADPLTARYPELVAALDADPSIPALNARISQKTLEQG